MSTLYDRVAAKVGGGAALAAARLRREVLVALLEAFEASGLQSQSELARRLHVRRSAVNQVLRGDGNVRINTLAEYLYALGFESNLTIVPAGEPRQAAIEGRPARPASLGWNTTSAVFFVHHHALGKAALQHWWLSSPGDAPAIRVTMAATLRSANFTLFNATPTMLRNVVVEFPPGMYEQDVSVPESTSGRIIVGELVGELNEP